MDFAAFEYTRLDHPEVLKALFHPRREVTAETPPQAVDYAITVEAGVRVGARFFLSHVADPNILFFHGNGEIVGDYDDIGPIYNRHGLSLLAVDYRGYGRSDGVPTVSAMMRDAHVIFKEVRQWLEDHDRPGPLVVMGRSLGSASALELAACYEEALAGVVIESGFALTLPLLHCLGVDTEPLGITEADGFNNVQKIERVAKPMLIMHGRHDQVIPVESAEVLQMHCAARGKEFQIIPGADHNTVMVQGGDMYFETIKRFTNKIEGKRPKHSFRRKRKK